jgi:hypothetical protein
VVACAACPTHVALENDGLQALSVHYAQFDGDPEAVTQWEPLWVFAGQVGLQSRRVQAGKQTGKTAHAFWSVPRRFYVPAGALPASQIRSVGLKLLRQQPALQPLPAPPQAARMRPALLSAADAAQFAEFFVLDLEAKRKDMLHELQFDLTLSAPALWAVAGFESLGDR